MTINLADNNPRISYTVNAGVTQTTFDVPFEFFDLADLNVYVDDIEKTATTHYTIASGGSGSKGVINLTVTGATGNSTVVLTRDIALERTTDFQTSGPFAVASLNTELDRFTAIAADLNDKAGRGLQLSDFDSVVSLAIPSLALRANKYLAFDSSGNATATAGTADVTPISTAMGSVVGGATLDIAKTALLSGTNISLNTANTITTLNSNGDLTLTPNGTGTVVVSTDLDVDNININGNTISSTDTNGNITLDPNGTGSVAITSANLVLTSGNGIDFSATADSSGTAASEVFDDYEEGSFTPTWSSGLTSISYTSQVGRYVKIGTFVYCQIFLDASSATKASSQVKIGGLPFTSADVTGSEGSAVCATTAGGFNIGDNGVCLAIEKNTTEIVFSSQSGAAFVGNDLATQTASMQFTATYIAA